MIDDLILNIIIIALAVIAWFILHPDKPHAENFMNIYNDDEYRAYHDSDYWLNDTNYMVPSVVNYFR